MWILVFGKRSLFLGGGGGGGGERKRWYLVVARTLK